MIRTQVYLPDDLYKDMLLASKTFGVKTSDLFRAGLRKEISHRMKNKKIVYPLTNMIGKGGKGGPTDLATNLDYYLYDEPYEGPTHSPKSSR